jgi:hypothetical protein
MLIGGEGLLAENFCDVTLMGIAWQAEGLVLDVVLADTKLLGSTAARLVSRWPRSAVVKLDMSRNPGPPLTWEGKVTRSPAGGFCLVLDFASSGDIAIECQELELERRP